MSLPIVGTFIPAAAKSKPFTGTVGVTAGSVDEGVGSPDGAGAGASHATHFEADSEFVTMQSEHAHISFLGVGAFIPAAAKSNPCTGGLGLKASVEDPGGKGLGILGGLGLLALNLWRGGS